MVWGCRGLQTLILYGDKGGEVRFPGRQPGSRILAAPPRLPPTKASRCPGPPRPNRAQGAHTCPPGTALGPPAGLALRPPPGICQPRLRSPGAALERCRLGTPARRLGSLPRRRSRRLRPVTQNPTSTPAAAPSQGRRRSARARSLPPRPRRAVVSMTTGPARARARAQPTGLGSRMGTRLHLCPQPRGCAPSDCPSRPVLSSPPCPAWAWGTGVGAGFAGGSRQPCCGVQSARLLETPEVRGQKGGVALIPLHPSTESRSSRQEPS